MNTDRIFARAANWTLNRALAWSVVLTLTGGAAALWPALQIESDVSRLLPAENPVTRLFRATYGAAGTNRQMIVLVPGPEPGPDLDAHLHSVAERLRASPFVQRVDATTDALFQGASTWKEAPLWFLPAATLDELAGRLTGPGRDAALDRMRQRLADDPMAGTDIVTQDPLDLRTLYAEASDDLTDGRFVSGSAHLVFRQSHLALFRIVGKPAPFDTDSTRALMDDLRQRLDGLSPRFVGTYARVEGDSGRIRDDLVLSASVSVLLVGLFLLWTFRRVQDLAATLVPVVLAVFWTLPIGSALLGALTPLTMSAAAILMGLGVDFSIHYLGRYRALRARASHPDAVRGALASVGLPMFVALLTTALAFSSFAAAEFDGLRVFGWLLALGLVLAFTACLLLTPRIAALWPSDASRSRPSWLLETLLRFERGPYGRHAAVAVLAGGLFGFALAATLGVDFSTDSRHLRPFDDPTWAAERQLEADLGHALNPVVFSFSPSTDPQTIRDAFQSLQGLFAFTDRPDLSRIDAQASARVQAFRTRIAGWRQDLTRELTARGFRPEPFAEGLDVLADRLRSDPVSVSGVLPSNERILGQDRVVVRAWLRDGLHAMAAWKQVRARIEATFPDDTEFTHVYALLMEMENVLGRDLTVTGGLTAALALVLLMGLCGGVWPGLVAALPAFATLGVALGGMAWFGVPLTMSNCVAVPFLIGIGVDAGIHLVAELRDPTPGVRTAPQAVWRTSVTTALGFGSLALATVPGIAALGILMMVGVGTCVVATLVVVPSVWDWAGSASAEASSESPSRRSSWR